ncbi:glycoside hydrolase family 2 TIM barrel-domain containing protein [Clostridium sp. B9]|uniref:glycoside hydrolase family 2 TIM barrel-domain containing protein n=1 Tax=Clostridium sp. B9 TaxID=3423224 RepID=UPI003D2ED031
MKQIHQKGSALGVAIAMALTLSPTVVRAESKQATESETVHVGFIKDGERSTIFNENWRFIKGNPSGAEGVNFDDSSWRGLNLPHDWSIEGDFTVEGEAESGFLLGGTGWYRKSFVVPEKFDGQDFTLNFDGVYMNAEVYVNGKKLGEHNYGYTAFAFDITDALICDGETENIIAVKVTNNIPTSRWYSGSGIYRDVTLSVTDPIHVGHLGTSVTTPNIETQNGGDVDVVVETVVENESKEEANVSVKTTIIDENGEEVSEPVVEAKVVGVEESIEFNQTAIVNQPELWSVDNPSMYEVKSEVIVNGEVVDTYYTDFGFRYYNFDKDTGFSLNGENMKLKGVCMHHDQGALGAASYYRAVERQMEIMKEMGVNAIRVSHNPASDMLLEICDKLGLMVINEAFDTWTNPKNGNVNDFSKYFNEAIGEENEIINGNPEMSWGEFEARSMVKNSKNSPSVIMWSIGNEVLEGISGSASNYATVSQNIIDWISDEDPTKPVTIGDNRSKGGQQLAIDINNVITENNGIVGLNYSNDAQFESLRQRYPDWTLYASETSSAVHTRGYYGTKGINYSNHRISEYDNNQTRVGWGHSASDAWRFVIENDYNAGEFVWTGFDYIGEPTPWNGTGTGSVGGGNGPSPKSSYFGIVDTAGFPKDIYYLYQSQWNDDVNTLHVLPSWDREDIYMENGMVEVNVFTDAHKVELYLNDEKIGEQTSTEHVTEAGYKYYTFGEKSFYPVFNVPYEEGVLTAKAYDKEGNEITNTEGRSSVTTSGTPTTVELSADNTTIDSDGYDLSYITIDIVDENGNIVPGADNRLNFELEGNGKIVGLDNGDQTDIESYKPTTDTTGSKRALSGKALVIVQSTKDAGTMTLNVSGDGLETQSIEINTVNNSSEDRFLESYDIVKEYYVGLGERPELPSTVEGRYSDGTTETFNISWNDYSEGELNTPQIFKVTGKLEGTDVAVNVNVHVVGEVASMENYSTFTYANQDPVLPKTVKGYLVDGAESEEFKVDWNLEGLDFTTPNTTVEVPGKVSLLGNVYEVKAYVRVVEELKAAANLAINNSENKDVPTLSQSCTTTSDNLNAINNGVTNNSSNTAERWTNWNERNLTFAGEPMGAHVQLDWDSKHSIDRLDLWLFTDNIYGRIPKKVEISYRNEAGEYVKVSHSNTTEVPYFSGETTYFLNEVINTDSIRIYMQQPEVGKCIGLTEVAVYEYVPKVNANTTDTLSGIKLDGAELEGFDSSTMEYTVNVEALPETVEAIAEENAAVTVLPIHNNKSTIVVRSESGSKNVYTVTYVLEDQTNSLDVNEDGVVNVGDLSIVSKYQGEIIEDNKLSEKSDVNKDGMVDTKDIQLVMDSILGE